MTIPTAQFVAGPCRDNRDYVEVWVEPKGQPGEKYRLSVGGASALIAELIAAVESHADTGNPDFRGYAAALPHIRAARAAFRAAQTDTHPKGGDCLQAPALLSGTVPEGDAPKSPVHPHTYQDTQ